MNTCGSALGPQGGHTATPNEAPPLSSEAPPLTAEVVAELGLSLTDSMGTLTQGPAVMIGRPSPPAAPKADHRSDRPCHPKWLVRPTVCRNWSGQPPP